MADVKIQNATLEIINSTRKIMKYRADIDGIRAIAVILVIFFHLNIYPFSSGFIGVDVFFVISGYLISLIIISSLEENKFSLLNFYSRRLWRLKPTLLTVLILCTIFASSSFLSEDFNIFLKSIKYTEIFLSNQFFSKETTEYAASSSIYFPLLHTWSLSIEWQWYLCFPVAMMLFFKFIKKKNHIHFILSITLFTIIISFILTYEYGNQAYYKFAPRIFEFMTGASTALFLRQKTNLTINGKLLPFVGLAAIAIIVLISMMENIITGYPDFYAVIICMATSALIFCGHYKNLASKILSFPVFTYIGKISYSLYLWHWPVISFSAYLAIQDNLLTKIIQIIIISILSIASYHFVEKPLRKPKMNAIASILLLALTPALLAIFIYHLSKSESDWPQRLGTEYNRIYTTLEDYPVPLRRKCFTGTPLDMEKICKAGAIGSKNKALLIGDSNSNHFWRFLDVLAKDAGVEITALSSSSCLTLLGIRPLEWDSVSRVNQKCERNIEYYYQLIENNNYKFVIIGESWERHSGKLAPIKENEKAEPDALLLRALNYSVDVIKQRGAQVILMKEIAQMPDGYMQCFYSKFKRQRFFQDMSYSCDFKITNEKKWFESAFESVAHKGVVFISPREIQCPGDICGGNINGIPVFRDNGHLTDYASYIFGIEYLKSHTNPLISSLYQ